MSAPKQQKTQAINGLWSATMTEYHADKNYVSHSALEDFRQSIPRYHGLHVTGEIKRDDDSAAKGLGTAVHAFLLQADVINDVLVQWPAGDGKQAEVKKARERVSVEAGHTAQPKVRSLGARTIVTVDEWEQAERMAEAARKHPLVREMVDLPGYCEQSIRVECTERGKLKARFDKLFKTGHVLDIKTTRHLNPQSFSKDAYNFGYHRQAAFYEDVRDLSLGPGQGMFVYAVISSEEPYETIVYVMEQSARNLGRAENNELLSELRDREQRNDWSSRWTGVQRLDIPNWCYPKEQR